MTRASASVMGIAFCMSAGSALAAMTHRPECLAAPSATTVQVADRIEVRLPRPPAAPQQRWILLEPPITHIVRETRNGEGPIQTLPAIQQWHFEATGPGAQRLRFELRPAGVATREPVAACSVLLEVK